LPALVQAHHSDPAEPDLLVRPDRGFVVSHAGIANGKFHGILVYSVYSYAIYAFDVRFNALFLVYVAVLGLSIYALIGGLTAVDPVRVKAAFGQRVPVRSTTRPVSSAGAPARCGDRDADGRPRGARCQRRLLGDRGRVRRDRADPTWGRGPLPARP
jgi:hypothetical protein